MKTNSEEDLNNKDARFRKLNMKAEEKKINLFYLKDILVKENNSD